MAQRTKLTGAERTARQRRRRGVRLSEMLGTMLGQLWLETTAKRNDLLVSTDYDEEMFARPSRLADDQHVVLATILCDLDLSLVAQAYTSSISFTQCDLSNLLSREFRLVASRRLRAHSSGAKHESGQGDG